MLRWLLGKKKEGTALCTIANSDDCDCTNEQDNKKHTYKDSKESGKYKDKDSQTDTENEEVPIMKTRVRNGPTQRVIYIVINFISITIII